MILGTLAEFTGFKNKIRALNQSKTEWRKNKKGWDIWWYFKGV